MTTMVMRTDRFTTPSLPRDVTGFPRRHSNNHAAKTDIVGVLYTWRSLGSSTAMEMLSSSFGTLLRRYRTAAGLTQEQLALRSGLSVRGISDLERGARTRPHRATVAMLKRALPLSGAEGDLLAAAGHSPRHH